MKETRKKLDRAKLFTSPLLEIISDSFNFMRAYVNRDIDSEIFLNGQPLRPTLRGSPNFEMVGWNNENTERCLSELKELGYPTEDLDRQYQDLKRQCEEVYARGAA